MQITLDEFLNEYAISTTQIEIRDEYRKIPRFFVYDYYNNHKLYEEISHKEITLIGVEDNVMVIYL